MPTGDLSWMGFDPDAAPEVVALMIALSTLISEDLAAIGAGVLAGTGVLEYPLAMAAVFFGIWGGDLGLWGLGRAAAKGSLHWGWLSRRLDGPGVAVPRSFFARRGGAAILLSRIVPSTRLPLYLTAGFVGYRFWSFAGWTALAVALWTPVIVLGAGLLGREFAQHLAARVGHVGFALLGLVVGLTLLLRLLVIVLDPVRRRRWHLRLARARRSEFWPNWALYSPMMVALTWLILRHRCARAVFAVNPCLPAGGVIDESKAAILARIHHPAVLPWILIAPGDPARRARRLEAHRRRAGWRWPLILKPDRGERGVGVKLVRDAEQAERYLTRERAPVLAQVFHPGPVEVGVFWYRLPGSAHGDILGITDKRLPAITGDGEHTLRELIARHPRYRLQESVFFARFGDETARIPAAGERVPLGNAGNHAQGAMFVDGGCHQTPALAAAIEAVANVIDGFQFGRLDLRCPSYAALERGEDLALIELNGVTSEDTRLYDPAYGPWFKWRSLVRSWSIAYRIGLDNLRRGHRCPGPVAVYRHARKVARRRSPGAVAD